MTEFSAGISEIKSQENRDDQLQLYYQNVNGLRSKSSAYHLSLIASSYDIVVFTESKLNDSVHTSEIIPSGFITHRLDRNSENSHKSSGGGILIAVKQHLRSLEIESPACLEQICIKVKKSDGYLFICCIYLPPNSQIRKYQEHMKFVEEISETLNNNDSLVVLVDYNLPNLDWLKDPESPLLFTSSVSTVEESTIVDGMLGANLFQINFIKNSFGKFLDLVFSNNIDYVIVSNCSPH